MFKLESTKYLKLYKNKKFFIHQMTGDKRRGNLFILNGMTESDSIDIMNSPVLNTQFIPGYFVDRIMTTTIMGVQRKERIDLKTKYTEIKEKSKFINRTFNDPSKYGGLNLFYDIAKYNEVFFNSKTGSNAKRASLYINFIARLINKPEFNSYSSKKVLIPIDNMDLSRFGNSPISAFLYSAYFNEAEFHKILGNIEFILISNNNKVLIRFRGNMLTKKSLPRFNNLMTLVDKLNKKQSLNEVEQALFEETDNELAKPMKVKETPAFKVVKALAQGITGQDEPWESMSGEQLNSLEKAEALAQKIYDNSDLTNASDLLEELNGNEEFSKYISEITQEQLTAKARRANTKRNELLQKEQLDHRVNNEGRTLKEILDDFETKKMDREYYDIKISNEKLKTSTLKDFEVSYNAKQKEKDTLAILNSFSENKEIPMYIRKIEKVNTSNAFDKKETWTVILEDDRRLRHTLTFDMPLFIDDHFLYLSESKKIISHQLLLYPIVKTGTDTVQCTSNYNKAFITRYGQKISPKIERLKKLISTSKSTLFKYINGDSSVVNTKFLTNMDFDELAATFMSISTGDLNIVFNLPNLRKDLEEKGFDLSKLKDHQLPIGTKGNSMIVLNVNENIIEGTNLDLPDFIISEMVKIDKNLYAELEKVTVSKKYVYSRASILSRKFPLVMLLAFHEGLSSVMKKASIKYSFSDKRRRLSLEEKNKIGEVRFRDGYLYYELYPFRNSLLLNALQELPTENYTFADFDKKETYLDLFETMFGTRNVAKGFSNFIDLFLDPITLEVCRDNDYPTSFTEFFLHANALLETNSFVPENNMSLYRVRSNEIVNAMLYQVLSDAYANYKKTAYNNNPVRMSVPKDAVIKKLNMCTIVSDYSCINPIAEAESYGSITFKGPSGLNLDESFTLPKRSYDQSMMGLVGASSPYNNKVGVSKQMSFNPRILNNRGYIKTGVKGDEELDMANIMTPAEILTTFAANHDDSPRVAMVSGQSKHIIPVTKTDKLLIGNGAHKALPHMIGSDFINIAKQDGQVVEINNETKLMVVKYKDGSFDTCDLSSKVVKNGGGGSIKVIHISNGMSKFI